MTVLRPVVINAARQADTVHKAERLEVSTRRASPQPLSYCRELIPTPVRGAACLRRARAERCLQRASCRSPCGRGPEGQV
jgi:hypothetical protein